MKKRNLLVIVSIALFAFVFLSVFVAKTIRDSSVNNSVDEDTSMPRPKMGVSWAFSYPDIESLTKSSDFIGLVEIVDGVEVGTIASGFGDDEISERTTIYSSTFSAKVIEGILAEADMIKVFMTGKRDAEGLVEYQMIH